MLEKKCQKLDWIRRDLLTLAEVNKIFDSIYFYNESSFYIIESDGTYRDDLKIGHGSEVHFATMMHKSFRAGSTILVKKLENWNASIQHRLQELGGNGNVHLYLSPPGGTAFDFHTDDCEVFIHMIEGSKRFYFFDEKNAQQEILLKAGDCFYIPQGARHKAHATDEFSLHLSFGLWPKGQFISEANMLLGFGNKFV